MGIFPSSNRSLWKRSFVVSSQKHSNPAHHGPQSGILFSASSLLNTHTKRHGFLQYQIGYWQLTGLTVILTLASRRTKQILFQKEKKKRKVIYIRILSLRVADNDVTIFVSLPSGDSGSATTVTCTQSWVDNIWPQPFLNYCSLHLQCNLGV